MGDRRRRLRARWRCLRGERRVHRRRVGGAAGGLAHRRMPAHADRPAARTACTRRDGRVARMKTRERSMPLALVLVATLIVGVNASAQDIAPDQLVQKITVDVLVAIKSDHELAAGDKQKAIKFAEQKVLPYIDFEEATRLAVGRAWARASPEQKERLVGELRSEPGRTDANAAPAYPGPAPKGLPRRS